VAPAACPSCTVDALKSCICESGTMQENMYKINRKNRDAKTLATHLDDKK
jgi:hypothetical protein